MKSGFWILQLNAKSENGFHLQEIHPQGGFRLRNLNPDFLDFFLLFNWEIWKRICKTILESSGLHFANYACEWKTAVLKDSFSNPFSDLPIEGWKENPKTAISALKSTSEFCIRLQSNIPLIDGCMSILYNTKFSFGIN